MNKIKIAIISLLGGSGLLLKTCLTEERVLLNAEKNASKRVAGAVAAEKAIITAEIESHSLLQSRMEKIHDIVGMIPFDNLYEIYSNKKFINKTNNEVLSPAHLPILRSLFKNHFKSKDSFPDEQIKEMITEGVSEPYSLKRNQLHYLKVYLSKTYADQYLANYLERNSCKKELITLLQEYKIKRKLDEDGPLSNQIEICKNKSSN